MIGKEQKTQRLATISEALDVLEDRKKLGELGYEQQLAYEHAKKFSKLSVSNSNKLVNELKKLGISERVAVMITNVMPTELIQLKQILAMLKLKESEEKVAVNKIISTDDILKMQEDAKHIQMPDDVGEYITRIVNATRKDIHAVMGASPRADIAFMNCAKAKALVEGRTSATKEDVRFLARAVLSHRIVVRATGGIGVNGIIDGILATMPS